MLLWLSTCVLPGDIFSLPAAPLSLIIPCCSARLCALCFLFLSFAVVSQLDGVNKQGLQLFFFFSIEISLMIKVKGEMNLLL